MGQAIAARIKESGHNVFTALDGRSGAEVIRLLADGKA